MRGIDAQPAYILHTRPYRETSLLVEALTRDHGRVGLIARGVRGARGQPLRAVMQPLQPLLLGWAGRGELARLERTEATGAAIGLHGERLLSALYLNELILRLVPRGEPQPSLFWRYAACLGELESAAELGWELRRFERDLLVELGYGLALEFEADGESPIEAALPYRYQFDAGAQRLRVAENGSVTGSSLIALREDRCPDAEGRRDLRRLMRRVLLHHLGGRELRSWQVLADLAQRTGATQAGEAPSS